MAASIILAQCSKQGKTFGIRVEPRERDWMRTWAFAINEAAAKREGYDKTKITGSFDATPDYPGCPHCGASGMVVCGCGKASCLPEESQTFTCHWCGKRSDEIAFEERLDVRSGGI